MLQQHTLEQLHRLRLTGMAAAFEQQLAQPAAQELRHYVAVAHSFRINRL